MNQSRILPFYMAYPLPLYYQQEDSVTRDLEYLQQMYPSEAKKYQKMIAETLDHIDYEGSMIYDEYPDRLQLRLMCGRIYDRVKEKERALYGTEYEENSGRQTIQEQSFLGVEELHLLRKAGEHGKKFFQEDEKDISERKDGQKKRPLKRSKQLYDLIEVMLYQELYRRRAEERREKRKFTPGYEAPPFPLPKEKMEL